MSTDKLLKRLESDGIDHLWVVYHDYGGRACAKSVPKERFASVVDRGVVFARANLSFRMDDHPAEDATFLADTGDFLAVPDPVSYARLPYHESTARTHAFMRVDPGSVWAGCPRTRLLAMVEAYAALGLSVRVGFEAEFMLFRRHEDGSYEPVDRDAMFTVAGLHRHFDLWKRVVADLREMGVVVDQLGKEYGPAQYEGTTRYAEPIKAVDDYLAYKDVIRARAGEAGFVASFMPKPFQHLPGCGLHLHLSLWDLEGGEERSRGVQDHEPLSEVGGSFLAGLLTHARGLTGIGSPIVNSYKRLLPGSWAPAHVCWAVGNRAALVRVPGMGRRRHLEYRSGDNAANPHMYLTALLAAGLDGIRRGAPPPAAVDVDVGHLSREQAEARGVGLLPSSLPEALDAFAEDSVLTDALGPVISTEFLKVKRSELRAYDLHVHPWERGMYLESV